MKFQALNKNDLYKRSFLVLQVAYIYLILLVNKNSLKNKPAPGRADIPVRDTE